MSYCTACGKVMGSTDKFCAACGKPVAPAETAATPVSPIAETVAQNANTVAFPASLPQPKQKSHALRTIGWIALAVVILVVVFLWMGPDPKDSLTKAGVALQQHDAQTFHNYVDVQSVLEDWTDQAVRNWLLQNGGGAGQSLVAKGIAAGFKTLFVPKLAQSLEQNLVNGNVADQPQSNNAGSAGDYIAGFVTRGIGNVAISQLSYQGISSRARSGPDVILNAQFRSTLSNALITVRIRMRRAGNHWRVIAIPDLAQLLGQLHATP